MLESDCLSAVVNIKNRELDRSVHRPVVEDIKALLEGFEGTVIRHVRLEANEVAHHLARDGCENNLCKTWIVPPVYVENLVTSECVLD